MAVALIALAVETLPMAMVSAAEAVARRPIAVLTVPLAVVLAFPMAMP